MRPFVCLCVCAAVLLAWCAPCIADGTPPDDTTQPPSPCTDSLYVVLKARPLDSLSDREYRYLIERDKACAEYQQSGIPVAARLVVEHPRHPWTTLDTVFWGILGVGMVVGLVGLIADQ
jgi:hypothetical protein